VHAERDTGNYPKGIKITDQQMEGSKNARCVDTTSTVEWNYTLVPQRTARPT
jgi:hypothetical protein